MEFYLALIFYLLGIVLADQGVIPFRLFLYLTVFLLFLGYIFLPRDRKSWAVLLVAFLLLGGINLKFHVSSDFSQGEYQGLCQVVEGSTVKNEQNTFKVIDVKTKKTYLVREKETVLRLPGDILKISGTFKKPIPPQNPGEFNYPNYLKRQGIYGVLYAQKTEKVGVKITFLRPLAAIKNYLKDKLNTYSPQTAALLKGLYLGDDEEISPEVYDSFAKTGVVHILSVSGLHLGLVAGAVYFLGRQVKLSRRKQNFTTLILCFLYTALTGFNPATVRAFLMLLFLVGAFFLGRDYQPVYHLLLSAFFYLLLKPQDLFSTGFLLSYLATLGIFLLGLPLAEKLKSYLPSFLSDTIGVTVGAQILTEPLVYYNYSLFASASILANLIIVPLTSIIMATGVLGLFLPLLKQITEILTALTLKINSQMALIPGAAIAVKKPLILVIFLFYGGLFLGYLLLVKKERLDIVKYCLIAFLILGLFLIPKEHGKTVFLAVGQGDAAVIHTWRGRTVVVDTGPKNENYDAGKKILAYLRQSGTGVIDLLVLTHPHNDHYGGAQTLIKSARVKALLISPYLGEEPEYRELLNFLQLRKIKIYYAKTTEIVKIDDVTLQILGPEKIYSGTRSDPNNNSIVLAGKIGRKTYFFGADIEKEAEEDLESKLLAHYDVVKIPHHGSNFFSPGFMKKLKFNYGVISVGRNNIYGFPGNRLMAVLKGKGKLWRTDLEGALVVENY
ncbi:DNA internalization-related competence protein ComEC/Rec2 [Carboxydothermus pertinax]|uniref:DNA internalization-related competence protein ComEC/Rec2 n=1 Tax=Carboxydothermus pertinax TaxID=870242 RepID=A0A1L8CSX5_9THEO|nr:DNA internalization-related competence protein ComEC/Rec2 [Carboxydothermus pertinax]GAV22030.1 DNA internalization-related competence protein ComEC/Rec2 [Carboxydothermus pertinax]